MENGNDVSEVLTMPEIFLQIKIVHLIVHALFTLASICRTCMHAKNLIVSMYNGASSLYFFHFHTMIQLFWHLQAK
jgi:hypothetical protein